MIFSGISLGILIFILLNLLLPVEMQITRQIILRFRTLRCAMLMPHAKKSLDCYDKSMEWLRTVPDFEKEHYAWHGARSALIQDIGDTDRFAEVYARLIRNYAWWRIVMAMDQVLQHYQRYITLRVEIDTNIKDWPLDPFDDKPLRYKKAGDSSFIIYSIGADEQDNEGRKLFVSGPMDMHEIQDLGFHILLK